LAEEQSERGALEEQLAQHLEESEDFMAQVGRESGRGCARPSACVAGCSVRQVGWV
jgi:hypothetical protein